jgi:hypothetical protein
MCLIAALKRCATQIPLTSQQTRGCGIQLSGRVFQKKAFSNAQIWGRVYDRAAVATQKTIWPKWKSRLNQETK